METKTNIALLCLTLALVTGCASNSGACFMNDIDLLDVHFSIDEVKVIIDHAFDKDAAWKASKNAELLLLKNTGGLAETVYPASITIVQDSYIKGFTIKNSIYGFLTVQDNHGRTIVKSDYFMEGKSSIIASDVQRRMLEKLFAGIFNEYKKQRKKQLEEERAAQKKEAQSGE